MKKYQLITYGCQANKSDSERIASVLEKNGYEPTSNAKEADLIVVNMCSVRQSAVDRVHGKVKNFTKLKNSHFTRSNLPRQKSPLGGIKTILTGCLLKEDKKKFQKGFDLILSIKSLSNWPKILKATSQKVTSQPLLKKSKNHLRVQTKRQISPSVLVPISNGCNNFCSYCVVPYVRGPLVCRDHKTILKHVESIIKKALIPIQNEDSLSVRQVLPNEVKEIWLLGQNVNDYTSPSNPLITFPKLLKMINDLPGNFQIKFVSPNPKNFSDELIEVMATSQKVAKYLNLPVQSGDNKILKKMNRPYTVKQYKNLVKKIRKKIPEINLSTDVIIGFPGETKKQFENTARLLKEIKFNIAYLAKYSPRPGTVSYKMPDDVPLVEKKRREKVLREILKK